MSVGTRVVTISGIHPSIYQSINLRGISVGYLSGYVEYRIIDSRWLFVAALKCTQRKIRGQLLSNLSVCLLGSFQSVLVLFFKHYRLLSLLFVGFFSYPYLSIVICVGTAK